MIFRYSCKYSLFLVVNFLSVYIVQAGFNDYVDRIGSFFGYGHVNEEENVNIYGLEFPQKIPYEVSQADEKFISEAVKLTGVALSELDSCQQRVVLKLKTDCHRMNDEQVAKMAVHLLNCQSYVEGRKLYPCTDEMSIKDCTTEMDSDTWTSYHLMSNRARAVCYMIRQSQFRGLAEHTVNRLMEAARDQMKTLGRIANNQEDLRSVAESTYDTLTKGHEYLSKQQQDLQKAQFHGQLSLEDNLRRLTDEKRLIRDTHNQLIEMTAEVRDKLENSAKLLEHQTGKSKVNHKELLDDISNIQERARDIFQKIDEASTMLLKQNEEFKNQYESTLKNLQEVNETVHNLVNLVGGTRQALEERLAWITTALGGTDMAVERLYLVLWHFGFILLAMLGCAFLSAKASTRFVVATLPPLNLAVALYGKEQYLDPLCLGGVIGIFVVVQILISSALNLKSSPMRAIPWIKEKLTPRKNPASSSLNETENKQDTNYGNYRKSYSHGIIKEDSSESINETDHFDEDFTSLTPPISRNGYYSVKSRSSSRSSTPVRLNTSFRGVCHAKTRAGTPCKLSSLVGRDFCYRHQTGDSVMGN